MVRGSFNSGPGSISRHRLIRIRQGPPLMSGGPCLAFDDHRFLNENPQELHNRKFGSLIKTQDAFLKSRLGLTRERTDFCRDQVRCEHSDTAFDALRPTGFGPIFSRFFELNPKIEIRQTSHPTSQASHPRKLRVVTLVFPDKRFCGIVLSIGFWPECINF